MCCFFGQDAAAHIGIFFDLADAQKYQAGADQQNNNDRWYENQAPYVVFNIFTLFAHKSLPMPTCMTDEFRYQGFRARIAAPCEAVQLSVMFRRVMFLAGYVSSSFCFAQFSDDQALMPNRGQLWISPPSKHLLATPLWCGCSAFPVKPAISYW
jgi:hypothetical protein